MEKMYIWNPSTCTCKYGKHLGSNFGDSVFTSDEIIEVIKTISRKAVPTKKQFQQVLTRKRKPVK